MVVKKDYKYWIQILGIILARLTNTLVKIVGLLWALTVMALVLLIPFVLLKIIIGFLFG